MAKKLTPRSEDYSQWYHDIIAAADLADYGPVKGTMVIKPYGYALWERMQHILDTLFKAKGVQNAYFPLFIPQNFLEKEAQHVEGFAPELAVVTHAGGEQLEEPLVIRPTSETIMYHMYAKWIQSYRDLPLLINQWANVVRWEMRTRLFLRTSEFLWQEGHTVHATADEADAFSRTMLGVYQTFAEQYATIPVVPGQKTEKEKFAGATTTYAIESMMQDGKALQMGTSHFLGDNFARAFDITFLNEDNERVHAWQTSWGVSTRLIGGLIMAHSDDQGLVLPPALAPITIVIATIAKNPDEHAQVLAAAQRIKHELEALHIPPLSPAKADTEPPSLPFEKVDKNGSAVPKDDGEKRNSKPVDLPVTVHIDASDERPGHKFFHWEKKGVPLRFELGPKDVASEVVVVARRDTGEKETIPFSQLAERIPLLLAAIQKNMYERADRFRIDNTVTADTWEQFTAALENAKFVLAHWDGTTETEKRIQEQSKATIRCIPFAQTKETGSCILTGNPSKQRVLFARAY